MRTLLLASLAVATTSLAQPAPFPTARLDAGRVFLDRAGAPGTVPVEVGCVPMSAVVDQQLHVACADGRVRSFELTSPPTLSNEVRVEGELRGVFLLGQQAWVEVARYEAKPLRQAAVTPGPLNALPPPLLGGAMTAPPVVGAQPAPVAAPVMAAPGTPVASDDTVIGPARQSGVVVAAALRAMVPIGTLGVGGVLDASLTWHAEVPFALRARISPLGGVIASSNSPLSGSAGGGLAAGSLDALYDGRFFAAGLGVGFGTFNQLTFNNFGGSSSVASAGFLVSQLLRIGALDGLNFTAQTQLVTTQLSGFAFYGGEALVQIPIRRDWQLQFRGGGSMAPFAFGDFGMRIGLGTEEKPRLFLTPTVGIAYVNYFVGPSVGFGFDYRL